MPPGRIGAPRAMAPMAEAPATGALRRVVAGHPRAFAALGAALLVWAMLPLLPPGRMPGWPGQTRGILAWDTGALVFLASVMRMFAARGPERIAEDAAAQESGQWAVFWVMLLGTAASFAALGYEFSGLKDVPALERGLRVALVAATLLLSWLLAHTTFALTYAHEWYERDATGAPRRGLAFPGEDRPDDLDFLYFATGIGMTFQVSDVQVTSRHLRRLVLLHGLVSFLFNTVIVALSVNIAAGLL